MRHYFQEGSLKRSKRERTRSVLLDGAIATVAAQGMHGASVKAITESVGLSNGTFYNHFDSREELFRVAALSVAETITDEIAADVQDTDDGIARIVRSTDAFMTRALAMPDWAAMIVDAARHIADIRGDIGHHLRADVGRALAQGRIEAKPDRFLVEQIGTLVALAIEVQLTRGRSRRIRVQTCESILRLLGMTPHAARREVARHMPEKE